MANETQAKPQPQRIPLAKIHDLPGVFITKQPDKSYGGLVTSIQANGVKEAVILRLREDGEYQLVTGYRRRRASELAKQQDIPAYVYEMTLILIIIRTAIIGGNRSTGTQPPSVPFSTIRSIWDR